MLVLARQVDERIRITIPPCDRTQVVEVFVTAISKTKQRVRIGIEAPREMNIVREELIDKPRPLMTTATKELGD